ncbi:CIS tube protein [Duganella radicis]|uniref:Peptidoglycan-binding protein n=1 Tax=Duganella radicis TaxID=551988 RepID=A0A6L6PCK2_9BURK|nr:peptidoglycan-binding protein [Duganella radicis]MTV36321.1 peptidoglycan-binding protein [Duganella radicis]
MAGEKALLKISGCSVSKSGKISVDGSRPVFKALINPSGYDHECSVRYSKNESLGQSGDEAKFHAVQPEKLSLKALVLDGTGAVPGSKLPVKQQVESLRNTVYAYVGTKHETPIVQVVWGSLMFYGRAESLKFEYTLFAPNGEPLRAKTSLSFVEYQSAAEEVKQKSASSPDLTHLVLVKAGDTLPLLCERIYRDPLYHLEVARVNGLTLPRQLEPGMSLRFPPLF